MKNSFFYLAVLAINTILLSCSQEQDTVAEGGVEFYLIQDYETIEGTRQVDESSVIPADNPLLNYDDIISYDPKDHSFLISEKARQTFEDLTPEKLGFVFGVYANDELIYTGYIWSSYASSIVDWVIIDVLHLQTTGKIQVQIGYPGGYGEDVPDLRNDNRIIGIFKRDNKLK